MLDEAEKMTRAAFADVLARLGERLPASEQDPQANLPLTWPACAQALHRLEQRVEHCRATTNAAPRRAASDTAVLAVADGDAASDDHDDVCAVCRDSGELLLCDQCPRAYHLHCVNPPLRHVPRYAWVCAICVRAMRWPAACRGAHAGSRHTRRSNGRHLTSHAQRRKRPARGEPGRPVYTYPDWEEEEKDDDDDDDDDDDNDGATARHPARRRSWPAPTDAVPRHSRVTRATAALR